MGRMRGKGNCGAQKGEDKDKFPALHNFVDSGF